MFDWKSDTHLVVDGVDFLADPWQAAHSSDQRLVLRKPRWMLECYDELRLAFDAPTMIELGICDGGSTALLSLMFRPARLVAFEISDERVAALDRFIESRALGDRVHAYFGVDQSDRPRLEELVQGEFGSEQLDIVIDDASHLLAETTESFNLLFPRLRTGGLYIIEDWSCQLEHERAFTTRMRADPEAYAAMTRRLEVDGLPDPPPPPLARLIVELVLAAGYADDVITQIRDLRGGWVVVQKGPAELDPISFDISKCYGSLGGTLLS